MPISIIGSWLDKVNTKSGKVEMSRNSSGLHKVGCRDRRVHFFSKP